MAAKNDECLRCLHKESEHGTQDKRACLTRKCKCRSLLLRPVVE